MKTRDLLIADESTYVQYLQSMKVKELERHADKIVSNHGDGDYNELMRVTIRLMQTLNAEDSDRFQKVQSLVNKSLAADTSADISQKLTVLITYIITKKFNRIHNGLATA